MKRIHLVPCIYLYKSASKFYHINDKLLTNIITFKTKYKNIGNKKISDIHEKGFLNMSIMKERQCHRCGCSDKVYHLHYIECVSFLHEYIPTAHESMVSTL